MRSADGTSSERRLRGTHPARTAGCAQVDLALEAEVPVDGRTADRWRGRMLMEWGPLPGSFGWVFPKGEVCTAGVVAARGNPVALRAYKEDFLTRHGLSGPRPLHDTGHLTRCRRPDSPLSRGRVLVAGDAAALLDHWSREGISYALRPRSPIRSRAIGVADGDPGTGLDATIRSAPASRQPNPI
ncbi:hypothetical protein SAM40697_6436 [Streptomyces ambofaciens]|uniref:Monooxygenase n=1 Tax=Streptomyces ambofaciens TaxID=1889 RepID=A0ABN4PHT6_STRAM|nr:hypothetical protein SAM40697_6436 [Streptomyces ambofaciens]